MNTPGTPPFAPSPAPPYVRFRDAVAVWAKIGATGFGGPAGQIALMHRLLVAEKGWISEVRFLHALNYCMLLPGPEAHQLAVYLGWLLHRTWGGVVAGVLFVLPGFAVILTFSAFYALNHESSWLGPVLLGLKAAVLAIVIEALVRIGRRAIQTWAPACLAVAAFIAIFAFHVPFPLIVLTAALIGFAGGQVRTWRTGRHPDGRPPLSLTGETTAEVPSSSPLPSWRRSIAVLITWGGLWAAPALALIVVFGVESTFVTLAAFFTKLAVVTFGGAYAVLAYVAQEAVHAQGWLEPSEMLDGLGLAETTPGPLIMVVSFVGFLAGFRDQGGVSPLSGGMLGGTIAAWVTFVPSFLWIFLSAPWVETFREYRPLATALRAITAAVVGVVLNLAVWFGLHVIFGEVHHLRLGPLAVAAPALGSIDARAALLSVGSMIAVFRLRLSPLSTLAACVIASVMIHALR